MIIIDSYKEVGAAKSIGIIKEQIGARSLYIRFDLDRLDPTVTQGGI